MENNYSTQANALNNNAQAISIPGTNKNTLGIAGFVLAITGLVLCWAPIICWLLLIPSFILSLIGVFQKPRTLALIGAILSGVIIFIKIIIKISFWSELLSLSAML